VPNGRFTTVAPARTMAPRLMPREVGASLIAAPRDPAESTTQDDTWVAFSFSFQGKAVFTGMHSPHMNMRWLIIILKTPNARGLCRPHL